MGQGGELEMNAAESATKFDHITSIQELTLSSNLLKHVPSVKNLVNLKALDLKSNALTMIAPGDFAGAEKLVILQLGQNKIRSVAVAAFGNLPAFRFTPENFNPMKEDGVTPFTNSYGWGTVWPRTLHWYILHESPCALNHQSSPGCTSCSAMAELT